MVVPVADQKRLGHILADDLQPRIDWAYALEQTIALLGGGYLTTGNGDPNGLVTKPEGYLFLDLTTPAVWQNQNGGTVWTQLGAGGGGSGLPDPWTADQTSGEVTATTDGSNVTPVTIEAVAGQTAPLLKLKDETGGQLFNIAQEAGAVGATMNFGSGGPGAVLETSQVDYQSAVFAEITHKFAVLGVNVLILDAFFDAVDAANSFNTLSMTAFPSQSEPLVVLKNQDGDEAIELFQNGSINQYLSDPAVIGWLIKAAPAQTEPLLALHDENDDKLGYFTPLGPAKILTQIGSDAADFYAESGGVPGEVHYSQFTVYVQSDDATEFTDVAIVTSCNADGTDKNVSLFCQRTGFVGFVGFRLNDDVTIGARATVQAIPGQTGPLSQWESSAGDPVHRVLVSGAIGTSAGEPADGDILAGEMFIYFDPTNGASAFKTKGKSLNGTVVKSTGPMT